MDFARKILQNYGWKDGDGLGKNKSGIAKPLKATLKFDTAGFGADQAADDFNNHWWERVFNEAAANVDITQEGKQIKMKLKNENDAVEISTKGYSIKKLKKLKKNRQVDSYGNFLQAATLTNLGGEVENPWRIDTSVIDFSKVNVLTDEELFKACKGRTAHKGARHGLKLSGKLSRIEQQEAELLAKMLEKKNILNEGKETVELNQDKRKNNRTTAEEESSSVCESSQTKKKKCKPSKIVSTETDANIEEICYLKSRKKKKANKKTKIVENSDQQISKAECIFDQDNDFHTEKRSRRKATIDIAQDEVDIRQHIVGNKPKNKKRKLSAGAGTEMVSNISSILSQASNVDVVTQKDNEGKRNSATEESSRRNNTDNIEKIVEKTKKNKKKDK